MHTICSLFGSVDRALLNVKGLGLAIRRRLWKDKAGRAAVRSVAMVDAALCTVMKENRNEAIGQWHILRVC